LWIFDELQADEVFGGISMLWLLSLRNRHSYFLTFLLIIGLCRK